jgi:hypothetical protein
MVEPLISIKLAGFCSLSVQLLIKNSVNMKTKDTANLINSFASGGQGDSFRENCPPGPPTKAFYSLRQGQQAFL